MVVDSTADLLPDRPTQVNVLSVIIERSMIKREMARARDVGLLSVIAFDSKSNYIQIKKVNLFEETKISKMIEIVCEFEKCFKGKKKNLHYRLTCRLVPNVYLVVVIQSHRIPIQRYCQHVDEF